MVCIEEGEQRIVEDTWIYPVYQAFFIVTYLFVGLLCLRVMVDFWRKEGKVTIQRNNRIQVITCLCIGSVVRALSFIDADCVTEELFRFLKDVFWMGAFVLIVLYWVELQTSMKRQMTGIAKLKPYLIGIMSVYTFFRLLTSIAELYAEGLKNVFNGLTVLVYLSVMVIGQYYGTKLLAKMKQMPGGDTKDKLLKMTNFIILENVVLLLLLLAFIIRSTIFSSAKDSKPWQWFWLKQVEKVLELISIIVLCLTNTGSGAKKKTAAAAPKPAATTMRRTKKKKKKAAAGGGGGGGAGEAGTTATTNPALLASSKSEGADDTVVSIEMTSKETSSKPAGASP